MDIRRAQPEDVPAIAPLFDLYRVFYRRQSDVDAARAFLAERLERGESVIFIATIDQAVAGFTQLFSQFSSTRLTFFWLLNDLFVLKQHRNKGVAKQLIEAAKVHVESTAAAGLLLETEKSNDVGNRLYPSVGFVPYNETNFYWWQSQLA